MTQSLRTLAALAEDPGSVPTSQLSATLVRWALTPSSGFHGARVHMVHTHVLMSTHSGARSNKVILKN